MSMQFAFNTTTTTTTTTTTRTTTTRTTTTTTTTFVFTTKLGSIICASKLKSIKKRAYAITAAVNEYSKHKQAMQCDHSTAIFAVYETSLFVGISGLFILRSGWVIFVADYFHFFFIGDLDS